MAESPTKLPSISEICEAYESDPSAPVGAQDWRRRVYKYLKGGDVAGMRVAALPTIQYGLIRMAHEAEDERVRLGAAQFVMGQEGQGVQSTINVRHQYEQLPEDQLMVMLRSRIEEMARLNPNFNLERLLLPEAAVEAELVYEKESK